MSALLDYIKKNGRSPQVGLTIKPLDLNRDLINLTQFLSYSFSASVLIPVDAFSFSFTMPNLKGPIDHYVREGDITEVTAGGTVIGTGVIDVVEIETTMDGGDVVHIHGRNLLGQLEDQSTVNALDSPLWANKTSVESAVGALIQNTRIKGLIKQGTPSGSFLFSTEPGESKLSALQRFVEPINCIIWGDANGYLIVGRPNMGQSPVGVLTCDRDGRTSNVLSMKAIRSSTQIPNVFIPVWSGQEIATTRVAPSQRVLNPAEGPKRLRLANHNVQRCIVVSTPSGSDPQSLSDVNAITVGGSNILQSYALREIARANIQELVVQANVKSHFNDDMVPLLPDQVYSVNYSRAGVQEKLYIYEVEYTMDPRTGPRTSINMCRLGRIVAGVSTSPYSRTTVLSGALPR